MSVVAIGVGIGAAQAVVGTAQTISGNARLKRLMRQRTAYQTPDEVFDAFNMATNQAQTGFGADAANFYKTQQDKSLSTSLGSLAKLGGDPNDISNIFSKNVDAILQSSKDSELIQLQKFDRVYNTLSKVAEGRTAEWADKEAILKDKMAAEAMKVAAGNKNLQSGLNMTMGALANEQTKNLYGDQTQAMQDAAERKRIMNLDLTGNYPPTLLSPTPTTAPSQLQLPSWYRTY